VILNVVMWLDVCMDNMVGYNSVDDHGSHRRSQDFVWGGALFWPKK